MRLGCRALCAFALTTACGGKSEVHHHRAAAPDVACVTSFACPDAERCESGVCAPDRTCPGEREPELLFEAEAGSVWSWQTYYHSITTFGSREFLTFTEVDDSGTPAELTRFRELATEREMVLEHGPEVASCWGSPARCRLSSATGITLVGVELGNDIRFKEGTRFGFIGTGPVISYDADYSEGRVVVSLFTSVELQELGRLPALAHVELGALGLSNVLVDEHGRSNRVTAYHNSPENDAELAWAPLESGASLRRIYLGPGGKMYLLPIPYGNDWFVLRDEQGTTDTTMIYRGSEDGGTFLGSLEGGIWGALIDSRYWTAERPLEPGPSAYARACTQEGCTSRRIHLDPVSMDEVASVPLPEARLVDSFVRPIACGGADVLVVTSPDPESPTRFWSVRIPGRDGFP